MLAFVLVDEFGVPNYFELRPGQLVKLPLECQGFPREQNQSMMIASHAQVLRTHRSGTIDRNHFSIGRSRLQTFAHNVFATKTIPLDGCETDIIQLRRVQPGSGGGAYSIVACP